MFDRFKQSQGKVGGASSTAGGMSPGKVTLTQLIPAGAQGSGERHELYGSSSSAAASEEGAIQRKESGTGDHTASQPPSTSGDPLPPHMSAEMEAAFNADLSAVRVHQNAHPDSLGALAFTQGSNIHFAPGQYDPHSEGGKQLLGHELAHIVQQQEGRVAATSDVGSVALNDDPALEREADELGARAARGEALGRSGTTASSAGGGLAQLKSDSAASEISGAVEAAGEDTVSLVDGAAMLTGTAQFKLRGAPIQARMAGGPIQRQSKSKPKSTYVPYQVHVKQPMTQQEFRAAALRQIFGGVPTTVEWKNSLGSYGPEQSPYTVLVDTALLKQHRGQASKERGISVGQDGSVTGAEERAKTFQASPDSDQKTALLKEIDRRYYEAAGNKAQTKIKPGEEGKAELWRTIRDEVLFQHEYIANLPLQVKELIKLSTKSKELTLADYDKLFAIAKKIEKLPPGQVADYASKVTGTTTDLDVFEASLDKYLAEMAERQKQGDERDQIQTKLIGLEEAYKKYKLYKSLRTSGSMLAIGGRYGFGGGVGGGIAISREADKLRSALEIELQAHGFAGLTELLRSAPDDGLCDRVVDAHRRRVA